MLHGIGDAGIALDKAVDPLARIHQPLKAISDSAILNAHCPDFDGPVSVVRGQTAGLKIKNNGCISRSLDAEIHLDACSLVSAMRAYCLPEPHTIQALRRAYTIGHPPHVSADLPEHSHPRGHLPFSAIVDPLTSSSAGV